MKKSPLFAVTTLAIVLTAALAYANNARPQATPDALFGKVIIINPTSRSTPRENARVADLGGKKYIVYPVNPEKSQPYEAWMALEDVASLRVFESTEDAYDYLARQNSR